MSPQQFSLRWNNHTKNLVQVFADNFEQEKHVDVTLSCQGQFLKAHKIVLGACSPYFQDLFDSHESTPHPIIIMNGYNFEDVRAIVEFMYRGEVMVAETAMTRLLAAAEGLQIKGLSNVRSRSRETATGDGEEEDDAVDEGDGGTQRSGSASASPPLRRSNDAAEASGSAQIRNANNFGDGGAAAASGNGAGKNNTPAFLRRRKRPRTVSYDNETKRKLGGKFAATDAVDETRTSPANALDDDGTDAVDKNDDVLMSINVEAPVLEDVDRKAAEVDDDAATNASSDSIIAPVKKMIEMEPKEKIPRPPNSFMIFANEWRRQLAQQFPNESNKEISVRLGIMWKSLTDEVKAKYFTAARRANDDHKKKYPDYHYNPKEARMRKMWKLQQQSLGHLVTTASHH